MKITRAEVIVCSPTRNFVTLVVYSDQGIYGLGDATLNGREMAVVFYLEEHVIPCIIGRNVFDTEDVWQYLYKGAYWKRGPVTMTAIAAVDMALWDPKAKALNVPLYQLLGGKSRDRVLVYCHANGVDPHHTLEEVEKHIEQGYKAIRVQSGFPGMSGTYGVAKKGDKYEPATPGLPHEFEWNTEKYLSFVPRLFEMVRKKFGEELLLLHDAHHRLSPIEAARLAKDWEPYHLFWLEDPVSEELQESFSLHLDLSLHDFGTQEHMPHEPLVDDVFPHAYTFQDEYMYPGDVPGLGVDINRELASKYPYRPAYLPINRRDDGTIWNW